MSTKTNKVFIAYPSGDKSLAKILFEAVRKANAVPNQPVRFESWEVNDIPGIPLSMPIVTKIDESPFIIADITYLNLNVVYEIGLAIGRCKRVFLIRHKGTDGDTKTANSVGIFDTLGYHQYQDCEDLVERLTSHIEENALPIGSVLDRTAPVYIIEPLVRDEYITFTVARIKKARYRYRSFNPTEDARLSATDAIRQVSRSAGVCLMLQRKALEEYTVHNIRTMFVVGLAHGMGKPTLLLAQEGMDVPLDVRDLTKYFRSEDDIASHVAAFCLEINDFSQESDPHAIEAGGLLQSLAVGDPTAENEMTTLHNYYLQTDQYHRAVRGDVNLIVGRKGSGKTALFIQIRDKIRSDRNKIVVDLKPEGYQLIKIKEDILSYLSEGARQHLIIAFWEYLILLEVAYKILEKDKSTHKYNHDLYDLYRALDHAYRVENFSSEGDFSERLLTLSSRISSEYKDRFGTDFGKKLTVQEVTEILYTHDIRKLRDSVSKYIEHKGQVWILFDNLDKGWSTQGVDVIDAIVARSLIDAGRKLEREMQRSGHFFKCLVFIRNDVYDRLMKNSADFAKDTRAVLDWTDPTLLREMMRLRLVSGLDRTAAALDFDKIWTNVCTSHVDGEESFAYLTDRSLMRPRNVLKIFNYARGSAINYRRSRINEEC